MARLLAGLVMLALALGEASAKDWPAFGGPTGQGHSTERDLVVEWSETANVHWKVPVPGPAARPKT